MARDRLLDILKSRFYWHGMSADVKDFINKCDLCQKIKSQANLRHGRLRPIQVGKPFDLVGADIAYLPKSKKGYRYVLVTIDYFTNPLSGPPRRRPRYGSPSDPILITTLSSISYSTIPTSTPMESPDDGRPELVFESPFAT